MWFTESGNISGVYKYIYDIIYDHPTPCVVSRQTKTAVVHEPPFVGHNCQSYGWPNSIQQLRTDIPGTPKNRRAGSEAMWRIPSKQIPGGFRFPARHGGTPNSWMVDFKCKIPSEMDDFIPRPHLRWGWVTRLLAESPRNPGRAGYDVWMT